MNKFRITYPNNKEVREYKSRTTKGHELIHAYDYHFGLNMIKKIILKKNLEKNLKANFYCTQKKNL